MAETREAVKRWRDGQAAAARRQRELQAIRGADPKQAVAEALAALAALEAMGMWPGPRDDVAEQGVAAVRQRWVRIQTRAKDASRSRAR